jgi:hypothetical protein
MSVGYGIVQRGPSFGINDDDVYLDKLQTRGIKKSILYM